MDSNKPPSDAAPVAGLREAVEEVRAVVRADDEWDDDKPVRGIEPPPSDAAQPEKVCPHCGCSPLREVASDAVPVAWPVWLDPKDDPLVLRNMAKVGYTFDEADCDFLLNLAKNIELDFATHPDDAPRPDKASQGSTVSGGERPEQVGDAPEGPWSLIESSNLPDQWVIADAKNAMYAARRVFTKDQMIAVRDVLNRPPDDAPEGPLPKLLRKWLQVWHLHGGKTDYYAGGLVRDTADALDRLKGETDG